MYVFLRKFFVRSGFLSKILCDEHFEGRKHYYSFEKDPKVFGLL